MTDEELVAKFLVNAEGVLSSSQAHEVVDIVMNCESLTDVHVLMHKTGAAREPKLTVAGSR